MYRAVVENVRIERLQNRYIGGQYTVATQKLENRVLESADVRLRRAEVVQRPTIRRRDHAHSGHGRVEDRQALRRVETEASQSTGSVAVEPGGVRSVWRGAVVECEGAEGARPRAAAQAREQVECRRTTRVVGKHLDVCDRRGELVRHERGAGRSGGDQQQEQRYGKNRSAHRSPSSRVGGKGDAARKMAL